MADEPRESLEDVRLEKLRRSRSWGSTLGASGSTATRRSGTSAHRPPPNEPGKRPAAGPIVRVAGRIMLRRGQGKVFFLELRDWTGRIQIFIGKKQVGEAGWKLAELLDLGDLIGVDGRLGYTKTGELTVFAETLTFLAKSLLPPPEKWHGLTDVEQRYRQRYVDLFSNPESLDVFLGRSKLIASFRKTMAERGFVEVETPTMQSIAGGAAARPFVTHHNALDIDLFLRIAPELYLKRLLVGGMERVFEIGRVYRNEGLSPRHNPEFTMLEAYQAYGDYHAMMDLTESLICGAIEALGRRLRAGRGARRPSTSRPPGRGGPTPSFSPSTRASIPPISRPSRPGPRPRGSRRRARTPTSSISELFEAVVEDRLERPDLRDRLPGGDLPADQAQGVEPGGRRAVRAVSSTASSWPTPTPSSTTRSCRKSCSASSSPARRRRTRWPRWTTTSSGPSSTRCRRPAGWASASTGSACSC